MSDRGPLVGYLASPLSAFCRAPHLTPPEPPSHRYTGAHGRRDTGRAAARKQQLEGPRRRAGAHARAGQGRRGRAAATRGRRGGAIAAGSGRRVGPAPAGERSGTRLCCRAPAPLPLSALSLSPHSPSPTSLRPLSQRLRSSGERPDVDQRAAAAAPAGPAGRGRGHAATAQRGAGAARPALPRRASIRPLIRTFFAPFRLTLRSNVMHTHTYHSRRCRRRTTTRSRSAARTWRRSTKLCGAWRSRPPRSSCSRGPR